MNVSKTVINNCVQNGSNNHHCILYFILCANNKPIKEHKR